jgi:hypothetical protein
MISRSLRRHTIVVLIAALGALAIAASVAGAHAAVDSTADNAAYNSDRAGTGSGGQAIVLEDPGSTSVSSIDSGFDWGAAGIGAGVFLVVFAGLGAITLRPNARHGLRWH